MCYENMHSQTCMHSKISDTSIIQWKFWIVWNSTVTAVNVSWNRNLKHLLMKLVEIVFKFEHNRNDLKWIHSIKQGNSRIDFC